MTYYPYRFYQTIEQLRRSGARGGRAQGRNRRARQRAAVAGPQEARVPAAPPVETVAQAMALLDAQFAWLGGAEKPVRQRRAPLPGTARR
jgi:hypothetical protein